MAPVWILILFLCRIPLAHHLGFHQPQIISVRSGQAVILNCTFPPDSRVDLSVWYKQRSGELPQEVGKMVAQSDPEISPEFLSSGLKWESISNGLSLKIPNITLDDEGMYFCGMSAWNKVSFSNGTFLAVTGHRELSISVVQSPLVESVSPGESMSLQCTVFSERRSAELRVLWFRAAAGHTHAEIIYIHHNSSRQCEIRSSTHSCVYNLSKRVHNLSDTGNYYCAVATCGKIFLGNGTKVGLTKPVDLVVIFLGAALGVCVLVIFVQAVLIHKPRNCEHCSARLQQGTLTKKTTSQDHDTLQLSYAALHFNERKPRRGRVKRGESEHSSVYSEVLHSAGPDYTLAY